MSGHTPGPWEVDDYGDNIILVNKGAGCVADVYTAPDARLIAAAPDLLEALIRVLMWEPRSTEAACKQDYTFARAAIAKAEGSDAQA